MQDYKRLHFLLISALVSKTPVSTGRATEKSTLFVNMFWCHKTERLVRGQEEGSSSFSSGNNVGDMVNINCSGVVILPVGGATFLEILFSWEVQGEELSE